MNKHILMICILGLVILSVSCEKESVVIDTKMLTENLTVNPDSWVKVPKGDFIYGMNNHKETLEKDFEIMVTEVTYNQYAKFLNQAFAKGLIKIEKGDVYGFYKGNSFHGVRHEKRIDPGEYRFFALTGEKVKIKFINNQFDVEEGYDLFPAAYVTWAGANAYADFYGYRLPTSFEFEKAARGPNGNSYPMGNMMDPPHDMANFYHSGHPYSHENIALPVGFYNGKKHGEFQTRDSKSFYGAYDMAGNVSEWISDIHEGSHLRYLRGGSMMEYGYNLRSHTENSALIDYASFAVGFRCVKGE